MDDSHEPSYYEIALTNRQVLVFFVVLLVCVVGAFFSGIWLGQQRAQELTTVGEAPVEEETSAQETETLAELNFFTDEETTPSRSSEASSRDSSKQATSKQATVPASGNPDTTLLEDLNGSERSEAANKPASKPSTESAPAESRRARVEPPTPTTAGGFVIQVFTSAERAQARKVLDRLTSVGYQAFISPVEVDGRTLHRVRVGPYTDRDAAQSVAQKVEAAYGLDTWVTANE